MALQVRILANFGVKEGLEIRKGMAGEFLGPGIFHFLMHTLNNLSLFGACAVLE